MYPPQPSQITCTLGLKVALTIDEATDTLTRAIDEGLLKVSPIRKRLTEEALTGAEELISCRQLHFTYPTRVEALRGIDLKICEGEFAAIVGPNGSGKSTLAKILCGLLTPTKGTVTIKGQPEQCYHRKDLAQLVSYVFQNPDHQLFNQTVWEEVAFGPRILGLPADVVNERVKESVLSMELNGLEDEHPLFLSKGERRRLALASILALRPRILIVDEPTTGQDYRTNSKIMELLKSLGRKGYTILLITHAIPVVAANVRRLIVICGGRILADGEPRKVLDDAEVVEKARLTVPTVKRIAERLSERGIPRDVLTVRELLENLST